MNDVTRISIFPNFWDMESQAFMELPNYGSLAAEQWLATAMEQKGMKGKKLYVKNFVVFITTTPYNH